jgi:hypothetical protein
VTWPQVVVGGGGIVLLLAGAAGTAVFLALTARAGWSNEPPLVLAFAFSGPLVTATAGVLFIVAAALESHALELAGAFVLCGGYGARLALGRWLRARRPVGD